MNSFTKLTPLWNEDQVFLLKDCQYSEVRKEGLPFCKLQTSKKEKLQMSEKVNKLLQLFTFLQEHYNIIMAI